MVEKKKHILSFHEELSNDELEIFCEMKTRNLASEPVIKLYTSDIKNILQEKYKIISVIKEDRISNCPRSKTGQKGVWKFKIEVARPSKTRKPSNTTRKKQVTKSAFSDRIKNIAINKQKEYEKDD